MYGYIISTHNKCLIITMSKFIEILEQWCLEHPEESNLPIHKSTSGKIFTTKELISELTHNTKDSEIVMDKLVEVALRLLLSVSTNCLK